MEKIKVAVNGFGRIGRLVTRKLVEDEHFEIVAINDLTDAKTLAHLFLHDSVHKRFNGTVEHDGDFIVINGKRIRIYSERDASKLPWKELGVDMVIESSGVYRTKEKAMMHIEAGAKKVLITAPAKGDVKTIVMGVNDSELSNDDIIVSNASCTTNSLAPIVKILNDKFGIVKGMMTTIHGYTNDQRILDLPHRDLRRARAAAINSIPTTTGAAVAVTKVIPELKGKLDGLAIRVPVPDGSITDFTAVLKKDVTVEEVNAAVKEAAEGAMKGIVEYSEEELVSTDIIGRNCSAIFDSKLTKVMEGNMVKVFSWYDNEWGYSMRVVDLANKMRELM